MFCPRRVFQPWRGGNSCARPWRLTWGAAVSPVSRPPVRCYNGLFLSEKPIAFSNASIRPSPQIGNSPSPRNRAHRKARREPRLLQCRYTCSTCRLRRDHWSGSSLCPPSCDPTHATGVTPHRDALEADPICLNGQTFGHPASWKSATILQMITGPGSPGSGAARGCAGRWCAPGSGFPTATPRQASWAQCRGQPPAPQPHPLH